jgi:DNA modification methylase
MTPHPYCNLKACGNIHSHRVGGFAGSDRFGQGGDSPIAAQQNRKLTSGTSRCSDVITVPIGTMDKGVMHPAMYPRGIPEFLIQTFTKEGDVVLDPFVGSGQTCIAAIEFNRHYIGFDYKEEYVEMSRNRIKKINDTD